MKVVVVFFNDARTDFAVFGPFGNDRDAKAEIARLKKTYASSAVKEAVLVNIIEPGALK